MSTQAKEHCLEQANGKEGQASTGAYSADENHGEVSHHQAENRATAFLRKRARKRNSKSFSMSVS